MPNFSGKWNLDGQLRGIKQGTWTGIPFELNYGPLYSWGVGTRGRTGQNDEVARSSPTQIGALTTWDAVEAGGVHGHGLSSDGALYSWGYNHRGQLGLNDVYGNRSSPVQVGALTNWTEKIASSKQGAFGATTSVIKEDGTLWSWGLAYRGGVGDGVNVNRSSPVQIGAETNWVEVARGGVQCGAINSSGELYVWGSDNSGRLGLNTNNVNKSSPTQVGSLTNWAKIQTNQGGFNAIKTDGTLWCWGINSNGQVGDNTRISRSSPVQIGALTNWSSLGYGSTHCFALKTDGTLWAWGYNGSGRLGLNDTIARSSPVQIGAGTDWAKVFGGQSGCIAIKTDKTLWIWGADGQGQLGQNTQNINLSSPVQIGSGTDWKDASFSSSFAVASEYSTGRTGMS